ncbi:MAG: hypothetical protein IT334_05385 [Thermomicrobiales bacterium]|nr:hypothetical protein [Thermomicrobiales bacterium]
MDTTRFDAVSRYLAQTLNRRQVMAQGGAVAGAAAVAGIGLTSVAAKAAQSTQDADQAGATLTSSTLFVQSFMSGSVTPAAEAHNFTVNLERGLGQTIFFSDRPQRQVGTLKTEEFLAKLGFMPDNPPNAAIVAEQSDGSTVFAVVELFNPTYDADEANLTYEVTVLDDWQRMDMEFEHDPMDLQGEAATFGAAHLLIDGILDCPDASLQCLNGDAVVGTIDDHDGYCYSWGDIACVPCQPWGVGPSYFVDLCNERFEACEGDCGLWNYCSLDAPLGNTLCRDSDARSNF